MVVAADGVQCSTSPPHALTILACGERGRRGGGGQQPDACGQNAAGSSGVGWWVVRGEEDGRGGSKVIVGRISSQSFPFSSGMASCDRHQVKTKAVVRESWRTGCVGCVLQLRRSVLCELACQKTPLEARHKDDYAADVFIQLNGQEVAFTSFLRELCAQPFVDT
jgi:hypothetical protein